MLLQHKVARGGGACVVFLVAPEGHAARGRGIEEARRRSTASRDVRIYRGPGSRLGPLRRGADRAGAVLAVGDDRDEALARARRAAGRNTLPSSNDGA